MSVGAPSFEDLRNQIGEFKPSTGLLFVLPVLLLITFLIIYPLTQTIWNSLQFTEGTGIRNILGNYVSYISSDSFAQTLRNTILWTGLNVIIQIIVGFGIALLINTAFPGRKVVRSLLLLPWVVPGVVVAIIFKWMYDPTFGIVNYFLMNLGLLQEPIAWLSNPNLALFALIIAAVWKRFPFVMIMIFAGLQDIDQQLQKAATIDGAPFHARLRHVTLPQLMPILKVVILLTTIWTFNNFVIIYVATGGGPAGATNIFPVEIYNLGFQQFQYGMSSTVSVIMLVLGSVIIVAYIRALNRGDVKL